jgi:hypothetical protein
MISFELDSTKESVTINVDSNSSKELMDYLNFVSKMKDHIHRVIGNELSDDVFESGSSSIKFVTIRLVEE